MLDKLGIRGFTFFEQVQGRGSVDGQPHRGTHTWPEMNSVVITVVEDDKLDVLLETIHKLGKMVVAEGVETSDNVRLLKANDCYLAQGYLFDKPLPVSTFEIRLSEMGQQSAKLFD